MDDVLGLVRSAFPAVGSEMTYLALHAAVVDARLNVQYLPGAIRTLKDAGWLKSEVGRRAGDIAPQYRLTRTGQ